MFIFLRFVSFFRSARIYFHVYSVVWGGCAWSMWISQRIALNARVENAKKLLICGDVNKLSGGEGVKKTTDAAAVTD